MRILSSIIVLFGMISGLLFLEQRFFVWLALGVLGLAGVWSWGKPLSAYLSKRDRKEK
ncbi:hypothetical protein [Terribacillus sp. DMT04]|uniref:hypothetical protein n=1 Tax=Terribacillus sp. DMT04 TaxID=2850441 RepID=UPI001C2BCF30|nr:hypothetical protein [Terribacillus sp. DMT04]QXE03221.1 hypothetical protein KS242_08660 [Terribacillus sp. DMT04]